MPPTREQFERLVHEHHGPVWRAARRVAADDAAAADVAQEVFLRVLLGKEHLEAARSERATLCWLATRLAANRRRADRRRHRHEERAMTRPADAPDRDDPARLSADADLHAAVSDLVRGLPEDLRVPLQLRCQDELTLAAIGTALRLPVSTVHDRVENALARLRRALRERGQHGAVAVLPALLARDDAPAPPAGLERRLLALGSSAVPIAAGLARRLAVAAVALAGAATLALAAPRWWDGSPPPAAARAGVAALDPAQDPPPPVREPAPVPAARPAATPTPPPPAGERTPLVAVLQGTVRDVDAAPVAGATVQVVAGGGYKPFALGEPAVTDARGAFTVRAVSTWLHGAGAGGREARMTVRLVVSEHGRELLTTADFAVPRPADAAPLALVLPASIGGANAQYELAVEVRDDAGAALPDVAVSLRPALQALRVDAGPVLGEARTGADGRAVLPGRGLGAKCLYVDGRPLRLASCVRGITIDRAGQHTAAVTLARGRELALTVRTVHGRELTWCSPVVVDDATGENVVVERTGDRFRALGLGDGTYTVTVWGDQRSSPAERRGVRAGAELTVTLKDRDDETDVGDHLAELHGELVDATTGEVLEFGPFTIDVRPVVADGSTSPFDRLEPPAPAQRASDGAKHRRFHEVGLPAGRFAVVVGLRGYATTASVVELREREVRTGLRIPLERPASVLGRVLDAAGQPVRGATVVALGVGPLADRHLEAWRRYRAGEHAPGEPEPSFTPLRGWSQPDGSFAVGSVPPGLALRLAVRHDDHGFAVVPVPGLRPGEQLAGIDVRLRGR